MPLSDDEIRAILIRKKRQQQKKKRQKKRRITAIAILILILAVVIIVSKACGGSKETSISKEETKAANGSSGIIYLDPGHGGIDGGTADSGRLEKDDNLKLALAVQEELENLGYTVYMSRTTDKDMDVKSRGNDANAKKAKLFISIHRNQSNDGEGTGVEVWIPAANTEDCQILGNNLMNALEVQGFVARGVHSGTLVDPNDDYLENSVPTMTRCLIEVGFTSNANDNKLFDKNLNNNAKAMADAIDKTYGSLY